MRNSLVLSTLVGLLAGASARGQVAYTVTNLGVIPGGNGSGANAISNTGLVSGGATAGSVRGFRWSSVTGMVDIGGGHVGLGNSINASGQITGDNGTVAFRTTPTGAITDPGASLGTLGTGERSFGYGINDSGQVTGEASINDRFRAFRTTATGGVTLASLLAPTTNLLTSRGRGINASGQVTGYMEVAPNTAHAFRTTATGDLTDPNADLGTLGGLISSGQGINASGQVTGYGFLANGFQHAFRTSATGNLNDPSADLGTLPGFLNSAGYAINASGIVVGQVGNIDVESDPDPRAMLFDGTVMRNLNDLIPANSGWVLRSARGINDAGVITGFGLFNGQGRAFLLTPVGVPEPGSLGLGGLAAACVGACRRRKKSWLVTN